MPRPLISTSLGRRWLLAAVFAVSAVSPVGGTPSTVASAQGMPLWNSAQNLAGRLAEERRKLADLRGELERLRFAIEDLRDVQVYPPTVTRLTGKDEVGLDKLIESVEGGIRASSQKADELGRLLADAVFVAREMTLETPNRDMIEILMKDNVERIARYLALNKELQTRWDAALEVVRHARQRGRLAEPAAPPGIEDEFFRALLSNMGGVASRFQEEFHAYKDSLAARASQEVWDKMARLDLARTEIRVQGRGEGGGKNRDWILRDLERLTRRYEGRISIGVIGHFLGEAWLEHGQPMKAIEAFNRVGPDSRMFARSRLGTLRAFFAAGLDDSVLSRYRLLKTESFPQELQPPARYLAAQSLYALGLDTVLEAEVLSAKGRDAYQRRTLFVYAKSLVRQGRRSEARQILAGLGGQAQVEPSLRREAGMALAHLSYEDGLYESALRGYQAMLEDSASQAEALFGMVWCNIRLGDLDGAEFVLKKLISQHPDKSWAIDGFMVFIRKLMLKAREEWGYRQQLEENTAKLRALEAKLATRRPPKAGEPDDPEFKDLRERVEKARSALAGTKPLSAEAVAALYQQALDLCDFVEGRYRTGEYSDIRFLNERETVLARLREAANGGQAGGDSVTAPGRQEIFKKLSETRSLALDIHLLHMSWLEELLRYYQIHLNRELAEAKGAKPDSQKIRSLQIQSRQLADEISERLAAKSEDVLQRIGTLTADPGSSGMMDWLLFQRGYLRYTREEENLKRRFALNRLLEDKLSFSGMEEMPVDYLAYEEPWTELIRRHPASPYVPAALYFLGYSRTARGEPELGLRHFQDLAARFPESPYAQQALIFIGEHYFNENDLVKAEQAYDKVLDHPESKYFDQALYKLAWTRYRANTYKSAISSFTYILEDSQRQPRQKGKNLLSQESLQYAALSLAESDTSADGGFSRSQEFGQKLGDPRIGAQLLHKIAGIYLQQGRLERAKRALETLLTGYPGFENLPSVQMELAQAYDKEQNFAKGAEIREKVLEQYGPGSNWYKGLPNSDARVAADSLMENAMGEMCKHYLYEAKRVPKAAADAADRRARLYRKAISGYERLLAAYPEHPRASRYTYQQAEAYYAMEDYAGAARKYLQVSRSAPPKLAVVGAYNAIVAAQELMRKAEAHEK